MRKPTRPLTAAAAKPMPLASAPPGRYRISFLAPTAGELSAQLIRLGLVAGACLTVCQASRHGAVVVRLAGAGDHRVAVGHRLAVRIVVCPAPDPPAPT